MKKNNLLNVLIAVLTLTILSACPGAPIDGNDGGTVSDAGLTEKTVDWERYEAAALKALPCSLGHVDALFMVSIDENTQASFEEKYERDLTKEIHDDIKYQKESKGIEVDFEKLNTCIEMFEKGECLGFVDIYLETTCGNAFTTTVEAGASCNPKSRFECKDDLSCVEDPATCDGTCKRLKKDGEDCDKEEQNCGKDLHCNDDAKCEGFFPGGTSESFNEGDACEDTCGTHILNGLICSKSKVCEKIVVANLGESCQKIFSPAPKAVCKNLATTTVCKMESEDATEGTCVLAPVAGEDCTELDECFWNSDCLPEEGVETKKCVKSQALNEECNSAMDFSALSCDDSLDLACEPEMNVCVPSASISEQMCVPTGS